MLGVGLLFVGAVLFINGLTYLGRAPLKGAAIMNLFVGILTLFIALHAAITRSEGDDSFFFAAKVLLFSFTYLWVAANGLFGVEDGTALGWYCLFVAALAAPTAALTFLDGDVRFGLLWLSWGVLWFLYWLVLVLRHNIRELVGYVTVALALLTCILPGYLILAGAW
ncbi:Acid-activated urea channel [bacterium HR25]|nr:Acid-activated urea channel [bacterium HR25]